MPELRRERMRRDPLPEGYQFPTPACPHPEWINVGTMNEPSAIECRSCGVTLADTVVLKVD